MDWKSIKHFIQKEFDDPLYPGSGANIDPGLVYKLDVMRGRAAEDDPKVRCIIHAKVGGAVDMWGNYGHAASSFHLKWNGCKAADLHFKTNIEPRIQYKWVESMEFAGIGVYYCWHWGGRLLPIAFHVDERPSDRLQRWVCREKGNYIYLLGR